MALLDLAARQAAHRDWTLTVAHFDHAQRPDSADEATFVAERCRRLALPMVTERLGGGAPDAGPLNEETMRGLRYSFFERALERSGAQTLVLAHQADDRAETFLMRLFAGSGPTGLASIRPVDRIAGITVVRPLLSLRRDALRDYLSHQGLDWFDDPANEDPRHARVWIRRTLLPLLSERINADVAPRIARAAELIEEESSALTQACGLLLERVVSPADEPAAEKLCLEDELWQRARTPLRRRLMRQWLWKARSSPHPPGYSAVDEALKFADRAVEGAELRTIERIHLVKREGALVLYPSPVPSELRRVDAPEEKAE